MIDKCNECGTPLENTPSGQFSACPKGHGKLHPRIMVKPFDIKEVPREVAVCPECGGCLEVECNEWTEIDGVSIPTQYGLMVYCDTDSPYGEPDEDEDEEENHRYMQCDWIPVNMQVYKWLGAVES
jgi:hypothetical protein